MVEKYTWTFLHVTAQGSRLSTLSRLSSIMRELETREGGTGGGHWGSYCEFFLSSLGLAVGYGNVYRFPYVAYSNGGCSFLIAYFIMLLLVGLPTFFMDQSIGQYSRVGANKVGIILCEMKVFETDIKCYYYRR